MINFAFLLAFQDTEKKDAFQDTEKKDDIVIIDKEHICNS